MSVNSFANTQKYNDLYANASYNVNTSHPLITSSQEYLYYKKYISIHSEDRDILKYPNSAEFEIELPEDYLNVSTLRLSQWTFPANYNAFSITNDNINFSFRIKNPYNPSEFGVLDVYNYRIFQALFNSNSTPYGFQIEEGFYNPNQIATELTNKFNYVVTTTIINYFETQITLYPSEGWDITLAEFLENGGYNRFIIVYNIVSLKLWFGNRADGFELLNETVLISDVLTDNFCIPGRKRLPDASNYGLSGYLGLPKTNQEATNIVDLSNKASFSNIKGKPIPRFYYGDVTPGDDGYWLLPLNLSGCEVYWIEATWKLNIMGEPYLYMDITGNNCIDETKPYNITSFTLETNKTNGVVDSAFAKMSVPATPLSQWYDRESSPYKLYYPPAERIRKLKFKIRYHNGKLANFGTFNYSFMLEFTLLLPQILRKTTSQIIS